MKGQLRDLRNGLKVPGRRLKLSGRSFLSQQAQTQSTATRVQDCSGWWGDSKSSHFVSQLVEIPAPVAVSLSPFLCVYFSSTNLLSI